MVRARSATTLEVDLHIHSLHSPDSMSRPDRIVRRARQLGLAAIAVTDHDSWEGCREAMRVSDGAPMVVAGAELKTAKGDLLALFVEEPVRTKDWGEAVDLIHAQGGLAIVPHPAASRALGEAEVRMADGLEAFNAKCSRGCNEAAAGMARRLGMPGIASSDAHSVAAVGNGRTAVPEFHDTEELRRVLLKAPVISRAEMTNPLLHYGNAAFCFALKGLWKK